MSKSCLNCNLFLNCNYQNKRGDYSCGQWQNIQKVNFNLGGTGGAGLQQTAVSKITTKNAEKQRVMDLVSMLDDILAPDAPLPPDLKIDDRDLPEAPNVYEFVYNKRWGYKEMGVFSRQLYAAMSLYGEYCPRCSDKKFVANIECVPYDYPAKDFPDRVQFLRHGKCPKCKVTRQELYRTKELSYFNELAGLAGQRSGKSALVSGLLTPYHVHKYLKISDPARLFTKLPNYTLIGTFVALTYAGAFELLWSPFYTTIKEVSQWYCLSKGTQVTLANGDTAPIEETLGKEVKTFEGSGLVTVVADTGIQECLNLELENGQSLVGTAEHRVRCLDPDGTSLIWKTIGELTEDDFIVVEG